MEAPSIETNLNMYMYTHEQRAHVPAQDAEWEAMPTVQRYAIPSRCATSADTTGYASSLGRSMSFSAMSRPPPPP